MASENRRGLACDEVHATRDTSSHVLCAGKKFDALRAQQNRFSGGKRGHGSHPGLQAGRPCARPRHFPILECPRPGWPGKTKARRAGLELRCEEALMRTKYLPHSRQRLLVDEQGICNAFAFLLGRTAQRHRSGGIKVLPSRLTTRSPPSDVSSWDKGEDDTPAAATTHRRKRVPSVNARLGQGGRPAERESWHSPDCAATNSCRLV